MKLRKLRKLIKIILKFKFELQNLNIEDIEIPFHKIGNKLICSDFTKENPLLLILTNYVKDKISVIGLSKPALLKYSIFHLPSLERCKMVFLRSYARLHDNFIIHYHSQGIRLIDKSEICNIILNKQIIFGKAPFLCME